MKGPSGILNSKAVDGFSKVVVKGTDGKILKDNGASTNADTKTSTCFVLTGLNDTLSIHYTLDPGMCSFLDVVVDGILRKSISPSKPERPFKGVVRKVCERGAIVNKKQGRRGLAKSSKLQICKRNTAKGNLPVITHSVIIFGVLRLI